MMFIGNIKLKTAHPDELITLQELMFRWPCEPITKICYELCTGRFTNIKINEYIRTQPPDGAGKDIVYYTTMPWCLDQASLCYDFNKLAVFKHEVEAAERDNPLYTAIDKISTHRDWYDNCTNKNYRRIAPLLLYVNFMLTGYRPNNHLAPSNLDLVLFRAHISKFIDTDEVFSPSNCLPAPKKDWILSEHAAIPILRPTPIAEPTRTEIDHNFLATVISELRERGIIDKYKLCQALLDHAPSISGVAVTRHIFGIIPKNKKACSAAKQRGNRLKAATREKNLGK
ncbi:hypothetical protein LJC23_02120 [Desulfovibrio sp. OttesenSCG-928-I05]|nr:hypothetical protein [Desulfovibrio sp. OttesenSCG-928-I05]